MGDTENLLVQIKVDHHQLVGDLRVEGQVHNENLLIHLVIHQTTEPLELQKKSTISAKDSLDGSVPGKSSAAISGPTSSRWNSIKNVTTLW